MKKLFENWNMFLDEKMELNEDGRVEGLPVNVRDTGGLMRAIEDLDLGKEDPRANDILRLLSNALQKEQDPEQIKNLKILKNRVHHATQKGIIQTGWGAFTKAEQQMMDSWRRDNPGDTLYPWVNIGADEWYEQIIMNNN
jgi:hypothetical protein